MPMQWNEQADAKLFANVLRLHVVKLDYQALARAMGETVTPKAISHRISKIKEKAQVRRFDWELYSNPPTSNSCASRKRGPKTKYVDDDDGVVKKKIKPEEPVIKIEENACDDNRRNPDPGNIEAYFWPDQWPPAGNAEALQHNDYAPYEQEERIVNEATAGDVSLGNADVDCATRIGGACSIVGCSDGDVHPDCTGAEAVCENTSI